MLDLFCVRECGCVCICLWCESLYGSKNVILFDISITLCILEHLCGFCTLYNKSIIITSNGGRVVTVISLSANNWEALVQIPVAVLVIYLTMLNI